MLLLQIEGLAKIGDGFLQPVPKTHLRYPRQLLLCQRDIGLALPWIIRRQWAEYQARFACGKFQNFLSQIEHREFFGVAYIDRPWEIRPRIHHANECLDHVIHVTKAARLLPTTIDRNIAAHECLNDKIADHSPIARMHAWTVGIEDAHHLDIELVLPIVVEKKGLGTSLALVVATADSNWIYPAPVAFDLRVNLRIAINLAG